MIGQFKGRALNTKIPSNHKFSQNLEIQLFIQLHSNLQEAKRCGDLETCTDFVISGLTHEKKGGSVVIKFDSFFRNKLAEDKLGNQIGEDIWDYDPGRILKSQHFIIKMPLRSDVLSCATEIRVCSLDVSECHST